MRLGTGTPTSFGPTFQIAGTDPALLLQDTATAVDYFGVNVISGIAQLWYDDAAALTINTASGISGSGLSEKLRISSDGNVGINEATPDSKLDILYSSSSNTATENLIHLRTDPGAGYVTRGLFVKIGRDGSYDNSGAHYDIVGSAGNSGFHVFEVQGSEKLRITKDSKLILSGTARTTPFISGDGGMCIEQNHDGNLRALSIRNKSTHEDAATSMCFSLNRSNGDQDFTAGEIKLEKEQSWTTSSATVDGAMVFSTILNGTMAEKLRITSDGKMGLRCNPETDFQVRNGSGGTIKIGGSGTDATGFSINYSNSGTTTTTIKQHYRASNTSALLHIDTGTFTLATGTSNTEALRINPDGQTFVQGSSSTNYPLRVGTGYYVVDKILSSSRNGTAGSQLYLRGFTAGKFSYYIGVYVGVNHPSLGQRYMYFDIPSTANTNENFIIEISGAGWSYGQINGYARYMVTNNRNTLEVVELYRKNYTGFPHLVRFVNQSDTVNRLGIDANGATSNALSLRIFTASSGLQNMVNNTIYFTSSNPF